MRLRGPKIALYRLFDVADEIELDRLDLRRSRLVRPRSAVRFGEPPAELDLGPRHFAGYTGQLSARIYPFGVVALRLRLDLGEAIPLEAFREAALSVPESPELGAFFEGELAGLQKTLAPALFRPFAEPEEEEFAVLFFTGTEPALPASALFEALPVAELVLGERERFSPEVEGELRRYAFSYTEEDLAVLGYERVLLFDSEGIWDVADLVEFVHAELLELAYYDRLLAAALRDLPEELARYSPWRYRHYDRLRRRLMQVHAEVTEARSRLAEVLKVTEDFFYARVLRAAGRLYGAEELAGATAEKLEVLADLHAKIAEEQNFARAQAVEIGIFALILFEVLRALWGGG